MPLADGHDTLALINSQKIELRAYKNIIVSKDIQIDKLTKLVETSIQECSLWKDRYYTEKTKLEKEKKKHWGVSLYAGYGLGINNVGTAYGGPSFGVALTYTFFRF